MVNDKSIVVVDGRVFSTPAHDRGMGRYVRFICECFKRSGWTVWILLYADYMLTPEDESAYKGKLKEIGLNTDSSNILDSHKSSFLLEAALLELGASLYVDATPFIPPSRFDLTVCPVVSIVYDLIPLRYPEQYLVANDNIELYRNALERLRKSDGIIAISEYTKRQTSEYLGITKSNIVVIYPIVGNEYFSKLQQDYKSGGGFSIVGVHKSKNTHRSISILSSLSALANIPVYITVPTYDQYQVLKSYIGKIGKNIKLKYAINEKDKVDMQRNSAIVAHLSIEEGFGIPLLEALFCSTPVICCDIDINLEVLEKGGDFSRVAYLLPSTSTFVNKEDVDSILSLTKQHSESHEYFERLRNYFEQHWAVEALLKIENVIRISQKNHLNFIDETRLLMASNLPGGNCGVADYAASIPKGVKGNVIIYTKDDNLSKVVPSKNVKVKSYLSFGSDQSKAKLPVLYHLAISERLGFGVELLSEFGKEGDVVILHDHTYLYGLAHYCRKYSRLKYFNNTFFRGEDSGLIGLASASMDSTLLEYQQVEQKYSSAWLREKKVKIVSHLPEMQKSFGTFARNEKFVNSQIILPMPIDDRACLAVSRIGMQWKMGKGIRPDSFVVGIFGSVTDNKYILEVSEGFLKYLHDLRLSDQYYLDCYLLVCGKILDKSLWREILILFEVAGVSSQLLYEFPDFEITFDGIMSSVDLVVACRRQDRGQVSHPLIKALCLGRPVVSNISSGFTMIAQKYLIDDSSFALNFSSFLLTVTKEELIQAGMQNREVYLRDHTISKFIEHLHL